MAEFDVLSYGAIGLDRILRLPHLPHPASGVHADGETVHLGGNAVNTAIHLATWGLRVALSGTTLGDDAVGTQVWTLLKRIPRLDLRYMRQQSDLQSTHCYILVTPDGERAIIGVNADGNLPTPPTQEMVCSARILTMDLYGGKERVLAARLAHEAGLPVVAGDAPTADHPALTYTTVAIASAAEIGMGAEAFAQEALAMGARQVVITDGPRPVVAFDTGGTVLHITPPNVPVFDTTGAGDAFRAGVVYGVLEGKSLREITALGVACGSLSIRKLGAASDPPTLAEVLEMAQRLTA